MCLSKSRFAAVVFMFIMALGSCLPLAAAKESLPRPVSLCGKMLAVTGSVLFYPLAGTGSPLNLLFQGVLKELEVSNSKQFLQAAKTHLNRQKEIGFIWRQGHFGDEALLRPRNAKNQLSQFIASQNAHGVEVVWSMIPQGTRSGYDSAAKRMYLSTWALALLRPEHHSMQAEDSAKFHRLREQGHHSGPLFISILKGHAGSPDGVSLMNASVLWTYPKVFLNILSDKRSSWGAKSLDLWESFLRWDFYVSDLAASVRALMDAAPLVCAFSSQNPARYIVGEDSLRWISVAALNSPSGGTFLIPTQIEHSRDEVDAELVEQEMTRRLIHLETLLQFISIRLPRLKGLIQRGRASDEEAFRTLITEIAEETELYLKDESDDED